MLRQRVTAILLAWATVSCAVPGPSAGGAPGSQVVLDQGQAGSIVRLNRGQTLIVSLQGNPTTGYRWELLPGSEPVLALQGEPQYTPDSGRIGAGGTFRFSFQVVQPGEVPLRLVYRRPFGADAPAGSFEVTVIAGGAE